MVTRYNPFTGEYDIDPNSLAMSGGDDPLDLENLPAFLSGTDRLDLENLPDVVGSAGTPRSSLYSDEAYGPGMTGDQTSRYDTILGLTGSKSLADIAASGNWSDLFKSIGGAGKDLLTSKTGLAGLLALLSYFDRQKGTTSGGGTAQAYAGPSKPLTPTTVQGKYGPLVQYAANGGLMQAYANGGKVRPFPMQDNGFVMTAKAVKGAEKLAAGGITSLLPDATMVRGRGTGTSDEVPAYIQGENGRTPARLSNGEAYIPPGYDTDELYALMHRLERNA